MDFVEIEKRLTALEDQEEIRKLHQRYLSHLDNLRFEEVIDLFVDNASVEVRNHGVCCGKHDIAEFYSGMAARRGNIKEGHMVLQPDINVDGNKASANYMIVILFSKPSVQWVQGRNECEYVKVNGKWKMNKLRFMRLNASQDDMLP